MEPNSIAIHQVFTWNQERDVGTPHKHYLSEELAERRAHRLRLLGHDASVMSLPVNANGITPQVHLVKYQGQTEPHVYAAHTSLEGAQESARQFRKTMDAPPKTWLETHVLWRDELLNWRKARGTGKA